MAISPQIYSRGLIIDVPKLFVSGEEGSYFQTFFSNVLLQVSFYNLFLQYFFFDFRDFFGENPIEFKYLGMRFPSKMPPQVAYQL